MKGGTHTDFDFRTETIHCVFDVALGIEVVKVGGTKWARLALLLEAYNRPSYDTCEIQPKAKHGDAPYTLENQDVLVLPQRN